jgi:glycosyltransferase involved in cell wall biosynthesis
MNLSVVIPTFNRAHLLQDTLLALFDQRVPPSVDWEILVVDNNSTDQTRDVVHSLSASAPVTLHYLFESRQGVNHARNAGVKKARGSAIAFTDDDVLPTADWVAQSATALARWGADGVGGQILPKWAFSPPAWLQASRQLRIWLALMEFDEARPLEYPPPRAPQVWSANMVIARGLFDKIGPFDTTRGVRGGKLYRGSETEFINRALQRGHRIVYDPALRVFHRIGPDRMRRRYFRRFAFESAEGEAILGASRIGSQLLGAPRWQYRLAAQALARWLLAPLGPRGFERQLDFLAELGRLYGYWKSTRRQGGSIREMP